MPTVTAKPTTASKPRAKAARKTSASRKTAARKVSSKASPSLQAKANRAKDARTNPLSQLESAVRQSERAVLIPVGAALLARDRVVSTVTDTISTYSSSSKTQAQLRRFERRGLTARNRLEREVRKARVRFERQLRTRRRIVESRVSEFDDRREAFARNGGDLAGRVPDIAKEVQERILSLV